MTRFRLFLTGSALLLVIGAAPASAEVVKFSADISGASEVPPTSSPAKGSLTASYDTASKVLSYEGKITGLTGAPTAAHFHGPAAPGKNAGVLVPIKDLTPDSFKGTATLTDAQASALEANEVYFNVHTTANPGGEARGQLVKAK